MKKKGIVTLCMAALLALGSACGSSTTPAESTETTPVLSSDVVIESSEEATSTEATVTLTAPALPEGKRIMTYLAAWKDWEVDDIRGDKLTHLYIAFARVGNDFKISNSEARLQVEGNPAMPLQDLVSAELVSEDSWSKIAQVKEKYPHLKVIIAVGGWEARGFSDMAATIAGREVFTDSVVEYIEKYNLDGIDIDWEYPVDGGGKIIDARPEDKDNFTELIKLLREKLGTDKEISFCSAAGAGWLEWVDIPAVVPYVDSVNLMAYDMRGRWSEQTDHHTALFPNVDPTTATSVAVENHLNAGVPADKLVVGTATYGREFRGVENVNNGLHQPFNKEDPVSWRGGIVPYNVIDKYYVNTNGFVRYWDDVAQAPYVYSADEKIFISYDDEESMQAKVSYIKDNGLAGIMYWEYTLDDSGKLLDAMYNAMMN